LAIVPWEIAHSSPPVPVLGRYLSGKSELAYHVYGKGSPVVLLAGGPGMESSYLAPIARGIAGAGRKAILLDLRGLGGSSGASRDGLTLAGGVADIEALRRSLGVDKLSLLGHSYGGSLAQAYAAEHPDNVDRLILLDSVGTDLAPADDTALSASWMTHLTERERADYAAARAHGDTDTAVSLKFLGSIIDRRKGEAFVRSLPSPVTHADVRTQMSQDYGANYHIVPAVADFPVTIIYGDQDWIRAWQPELAAAYSRARVILVPQSSHFPWVDNSRGTALALKQALSQ
jgi:proline iminopeptidase